MQDDIIDTLKAIANNSSSEATGNVAGGDADAGNPVKVGFVYDATPPTYTDGDRTDGQADASGNLKTTHATLNAGEDLTNDVQKVEERYSAFNITLNATLTMIKSAAGFLHNINIGMLSNPTITIYDNASGASGTILAHIEPGGIGERGTYLVDLSFTVGATAWVTGGNATRITGGYR